MKILIVGDSWGIGEWNPECTKILHHGLTYYLNQDEHTVTNISHGGISNLDIVNRLNHYFNRCQELPDLVLVFQTEYSRDYKHKNMQEDFGSKDFDNIKKLEDLRNKWIERFYFRLSEISKKFSLPIKIIGGCSDAMNFDDMSKDYFGCHIVCQSFTNLVLNGNHKTQTPVYSWYTNKSKPLVEELKKILPTDSIEGLLDDISLGFERENIVRENPELFYPDGVHPNRHSHRILFDFLKSQKVF